MQVNESNDPSGTQWLVMEKNRTTMSSQLGFILLRLIQYSLVFYSSLMIRNMTESSVSS